MNDSLLTKILDELKIANKTRNENHREILTELKEIKEVLKEKATKKQVGALFQKVR